MPDWSAFILGTPAAAAALAVAGVGVWRGSHNWLFVAAVIVAPLYVYLAMAPRSQWYLLLIPVCLVASGFAVKRQKSRVAWGLLLPLLAFLAWQEFTPLMQ